MPSWRSSINDSSLKISRSFLPRLRVLSIKGLVSRRRPVLVCLNECKFLSFFMCWLFDTASLGCFDSYLLALGFKPHLLSTS